MNSYEQDQHAQILRPYNLRILSSSIVDESQTFPSNKYNLFQMSLNRPFLLMSFTSLFSLIPLISFYLSVSLDSALFWCLTSSFSLIPLISCFLSVSLDSTFLLMSLISPFHLMSIHEKPNYSLFNARQESWKISQNRDKTNESFY